MRPTGSIVLQDLIINGCRTQPEVQILQRPPCVSALAFFHLLTRKTLACSTLLLPCPPSFAENIQNLPLILTDTLAIQKAVREFPRDPG
jgi:hypothetical protein